MFPRSRYIIPVYWNSGEIPYDPPRPWKDDDGFWYLLISGDACNKTNANATALPGKPGGPRQGWNRCPLGGSYPMWRSKTGMQGPWTRLHDMFTTNTTGSGVTSQAIKKSTTALSSEIDCLWSQGVLSHNSLQQVGFSLFSL